MSEIRIDLKPLKKLLEGTAAKVIAKAVFSIQQKMLISFRLPKSGREYKRGTRIHRASAKGEAPAIDTGFLANSIVPDLSNPLVGRLTIGAEYARILEEVLDRPYVRPAIDSTIAELNKGGVIASLREGGAIDSLS